jgi:hypothetical protein
MKDTPKHSFEDEFRKAFEDAEATPSPKLWAQIDAELANKEADNYKRKMYIYKLRVAAAAVLVFGFIGVWLLNSQFSGGNLADLPQSTGNRQSNSQADKHTSNRAANPGAGRPAPAQNPATALQKTTPGSASARQAGENLPATENTRQPQGPDTGNPGQLKQAGSPNIPETVARDAGKETSPASVSRIARKTPALTNINPATTDSRNQETIPGQQPVIARTAPLTRSPLPPEKENSQILLPEHTLTKNTDPVSNEVLAGRNSSGQHNLARNAFSAYAVSRIHQPVQPMENNVTLQAPRVSVKPNPHVWVEEEKERESSRPVSRWEVGVSFAPSQFNPNMQVNPQASASLSNARNNYYSYAYSRNVAPVSVGNTLQSSTNVGEELEQAGNVNLSYNVGVDVGYALSEKFSLQSGLRYLHNNSRITTDNYLQNINSQEKYPEFMALIQPSVSGNTMDRLQYANAPMADAFQNLEVAVANKYAASYPGVTEVLVYNTYQYLSIPLSLHYKLLDKKVSTDIGAGVSADIFMKNTIGNPEENISNQEFSRSDNGPYRDMSFSGLFSARVNYKVSSRYSVYLQPSYRTALNSITHSALVSSRPNAFGIGTGFQYRF